MYALVSNEKVIQVESEMFPVAGLLTWIECNEDVKSGWHYINSEFKEDIRSATQKKEDLTNLLVLSRKEYLAATDWYCSREIDEPGSYPQTIKDKRILAREEINDIEAATTLSALNSFNLTFE